MEQSPSQQWQSKETLAWTEHDGPGVPPRGTPRVLMLGVAGAITAIMVGLLSVDTLCPDHRLWVEGLATAGLVAAGGAVVALVRGAPGASLLTMVGAGSGIAIGVVDAVHDTARGWTIATLFAAVTAVALVMAGLDARVRVWERRSRDARGLVAAPAVDLPAPVEHDTPAPQR